MTCINKSVCFYVWMSLYVRLYLCMFVFMSFCLSVYTWHEHKCTCSTRQHWFFYWTVRQWLTFSVLSMEILRHLCDLVCPPRMIAMLICTLYSFYYFRFYRRANTSLQAPGPGTDLHYTVMTTKGNHRWPPSIIR